MDAEAKDEQRAHGGEIDAVHAGVEVGWRERTPPPGDCFHGEAAPGEAVSAPPDRA